MSEISEYSIRLFAAGRHPSGRDIANLCTAFEVAVFVSASNISFEASDDRYSYYDLNRKFCSFQEGRLNSRDAEIEFAIQRMSDVVVASLARLPYVEGEKNRPRRYFDYEFLENAIHRLQRSMSISSTASDPDLDDGVDFETIAAWITEDFGNSICETEHVANTNSIELVFNVASIFAILGMQHTPELKDLVLYMETMFNGWLGKGKSTLASKESERIALPRLPLSLERTVSKYDSVEITHEEGTTTIKLNR